MTYKDKIEQLRNERNEAIWNMIRETQLSYEMIAARFNVSCQVVNKIVRQHGAVGLLRRRGPKPKPAENTQPTALPRTYPDTCQCDECKENHTKDGVGGQE